MYAQLCKRLSEEAPNFEPPGQPCTFRLLLLNKCRAEFENRAQAFAAYEGRTLNTEDEERRHLAKCKMLGNIKFIGELGKLEILAESILHRCIQQLLARRAASDHQEDLECLAQLVRTCGRVLDSERGRGLCDQYFARIETLSGSRELAPRIRFMLRDVAELRRGGWVPRAPALNDGPVPIHQLEDEPTPPRGAPSDLFRPRRALDDVLAGLSLSSAPTNVAPTDKLFGNGLSRDPFRGQGQGGYFRRGQQQHFANTKQQQGKDTALRLNKSRVCGTGPLDEVQMRPAANSLLFTANKLSNKQPPPPIVNPHTHTIAHTNQQNVLGGAFVGTAPLLKEPAITIKPAADKNQKTKKDKGVNKEEACRLLIDAAVAVTRADGSTEDLERALRDHVERIHDAQLPDKLLRRAMAALLEHALQCKQQDADNNGEALDDDQTPVSLDAAVRVVRGVKRAPVLDTLRALVLQRAGQPALGGGRLAGLLACAAHHRLASLAEVAALADSPQHYPLLLDVITELSKLTDREALISLYGESKINLAAYVQERGGTGTESSAADTLAQLESRGIAHLVPQMRVQAALATQLQTDPAPQHLYRWIKSNVDGETRGNSAFVSELVGLIAAHVTQRAGTAPASVAEKNNMPDKNAVEREKALVEAYAGVVGALVAARPDLQLAAVYAVQLHAHKHHYPKGMLLRWFMYLYNLEVCEEDAFLRWREDVTDHYPGKGEALFQVNTWLTWLQQQESDDEEADD